MDPPRFWGPQGGPVLGAAFLFYVRKGVQKAESVFARFPSPDATAVWRLFHFLLAQVTPGRPVVRLNLDEAIAWKLLV